MVRRRTRTTKPIVSVGEDGAVNVVLLAQGLPVAAAAVAANGNMLEDQYFASPKRKDCKIDSGDGGGVGESADPLQLVCDVEEQIFVESNKTRKSPSPGKSRPERGGISGRTIGVPLATRSQTRTIENYFKAKTAAKKSAINQTETVDDKQQQQQNSTEKTLNKNTIYYNTTNNDEDLAAFSLTLLSSNHELINNGLHEYQQPTSLERQLSLDAAINKQQQQSDFIFDLSEDTTDTDNTELSDEYSTASGGGASSSTQPIHSISNFDTHRSPMRSGGDSNSSRSSTTDNIFLQEPVLTLNVDKSPNQASSIKINKTLEIEPIFSSPPAITASVLNGRFNKIVSLQCSPIKLRDSFGFEAQLAQTTNINSNCYALSLEHDNSSCDSGVAFVTTTLETFSPQPAGVASSSTRRRKPATPHRIVCPSPIKAVPRIVSPACGGNIVGNASATSGRKIAGSKTQRQHGSKTRRRLNQPKDQAVTYQTTSVQCDYKQNGDVQVEEHHHHIKSQPDEPEYENLSDDAEVTSDAAANNFCQTVQKSFLNTAVTYATSTQQKQQNIFNKSHKPPATARATSAKPQAAKTQHQQPKIKLYQQRHTQPLASTNDNRELTTFFQVRRSERKTKTAVKEEMMRNLEQAILEERAEGLKVAHFENKGRGIVSERRFQRGEFVIEYIGDLISMTEAAEREKQYALDENAGCYMYYFKHKNQQYCIDATIDTGKLGRLVNHSRNGNLITKVVVVKQRPHLILIAKDDIEAGEELTYDYGDRSKESLLHHPWLAF